MLKATKVLAMAAVGTLLISGCAEMVKKTYKPVRGGTVRYNSGWMIEEKNREKAIEQMEAYCSPARAEIVSEESKAEFTGQSYSNSTSSGNQTSTNTSQSKEGYIYLDFQCVK